ncbi:unnamed protein product [Echinostoma caproni]|uniref:Uncharacterized protein n=1 Tax=Echinostoma caproni TaxID=27848 RepID=A0A3P8HV88_9TREM|nr:unnamed protein product [Echinostoma caproni]
MPQSFKPYTVPHSHQTTPVCSIPGLIHPGFGPAHASGYPFDLSTPCTPRFHPLISPYAPTAGSYLPPPVQGNGNAAAFHLPYGAPWPMGSAPQGYPRQTLSAPDRMIHHYAAPVPPPPGIEEHSVVPRSGLSPLRYRGPPDLLVDHAAHGSPIIGPGTQSGVDIRYDPGMMHPRGIVPSPYAHLTGSLQGATSPPHVPIREIPHGTGSQSLPLLRPDRTSSLTGRSETHPLLSDTSLLPTDTHKTSLNGDPLLKSPISLAKRRDPADSDAFDSEDEVMSDQDEAMTDVALSNYPTANYVPFQSAASNPGPEVDVGYFLRPPYHSLASDPSLGYICSDPSMQLMPPCRLTYSPGPPADDGDMSSVSQSASQVPPRPSSSSESESAGPTGLPSLTNGPVLPAERNSASQPNPATEDCTSNDQPTV